MTLGAIGRILTENIGLKLVSLVFAVVLWLSVTAQQEERRAFHVPVELANVPESLAVAREAPSSMTVTIRGARIDLIKLRLFGGLSASIDCSAARRGRFAVPLGPASINLPEKVKPADVTVEDPKMLTIHFEPIVIRTVPVRLVFKGDPPAGGDSLRIVILPDRVTVRGAASVVDGIAFLPTAAVEAGSVRPPFSGELAVDTGGRRVAVKPERVLVEISIAPPDSAAAGEDTSRAER